MPHVGTCAKAIGLGRDGPAPPRRACAGCPPGPLHSVLEVVARRGGRAGRQQAASKSGEGETRASILHGRSRDGGCGLPTPGLPQSASVSRSILARRRPLRPSRIGPARLWRPLRPWYTSRRGRARPGQGFRGASTAGAPRMQGERRDGRDWATKVARKDLVIGKQDQGLSSRSKGAMSSGELPGRGGPTPCASCSTRPATARRRNKRSHRAAVRHLSLGTSELPAPPSASAPARTAIRPDPCTWMGPAPGFRTLSSTVARLLPRPRR
jgi:hypothetical protein